ncbi:Coiled-coil domain-containing protein 97, partial [Linum perenne]
PVSVGSEKSLNPTNPPPEPHYYVRTALADNQRHRRRLGTDYRLNSMESAKGDNIQGKVIKEEAMGTITARLSSVENLYFPRSLQPDAADPSHRKSLLLDLLSRDPAVFLERYGGQLTANELHEFDTLGDDYEIKWHLKNIRSKLSPTDEDLRSKSVAAKNRRHAYLNKLIGDGNYFSEDAMRHREPYLHHEFVGKFQDQSARSMAKPGERWSETLIRRAEEAILVSRIREEQQRLGVSESEWVGHGESQQQEEEEEEEEEEDEEEEDDEAKKAQDKEETVSAEEMEDRMDQFTAIMHQKFLSGEEDQNFDYAKIDEDETLDDHWFENITRDAEDKYFAEDD